MLEKHTSMSPENFSSDHSVISAGGSPIFPPEMGVKLSQKSLVANEQQVLPVPIEKPIGHLGIKPHGYVKKGRKFKSRIGTLHS